MTKTNNQAARNFGRHLSLSFGFLIVRIGCCKDAVLRASERPDGRQQGWVYRPSVRGKTAAAARARLLE